jgi:hypothetical protein
MLGLTPVWVGCGLMLSVRVKTYIDVDAREYVYERKFLGKTWQQRYAFDNFRGIGIGRIVKGGGQSYRLLFVDMKTPPGVWGTRCGHQCFEIIQGREAAWQKAREVASTLELPLVEG